jgi:hypothetical protein
MIALYDKAKDVLILDPKDKKLLLNLALYIPGVKTYFQYIGEL